MHVERALEPVPEPQRQDGALCFEASKESIAFLRLLRGVPECIRNAAKKGQFCAVVQEPGAATAWVPRALLPKQPELSDKDGAEEVESGFGWCAMLMGRSSSGKGGLNVPAEPGAAAKICALMAEASVNVRLLTAFDVDVLLVSEKALPQAAAMLVNGGHAVWPSTRVCNPSPWEEIREKPSDSQLAQQFAGVWSLAQREEPLGTIVEEFTDGDGPLRLQAPGGLFIEIRIPDAASEGEHKQASFGGNFRVCSDKGQMMCTQLRSIDFQPPSVEVPRFQVTLSPSSMEAVGHPAGDFRELWARLSSAEEKNFVALELQSEVPEPKVPRTGMWVFAGNRFARLLGLPRGTGLVAGTCCRSLGQLQRLRGYAEVRYELHQNYEVLAGIVEEPGLLKIKRMAWQPGKSDTILYSSSDEATGEIVVGQDCIVHIHPGGRRDTWRIVEWTFDPFTPSAAAVSEKDRSSSSSPSKARSPSSAQDIQSPEKEDGQEEDAGVQARSPSKDAGETDIADDESDRSGVESDAEKRDASPAPQLRSPSRSPKEEAQEAPEEAEAAEEAGKSEEDGGKSEEGAKVEEKTERSRRKARKAAAQAAVAAVEAAAAEASGSPKRKSAKEPKEKKKKKRKASPAADEQKDGAVSDDAEGAADAKAGKKKKKKKKAKKHKKEKAGKEERDEVAEASEDEAPAEKAAESPAAAPSSPKSAAGSSPKASPAPASAPASPAGAASAPNSPAGRASRSPERSPKRSSPKHSSPQARGGRGKRGRDRDEGGRRGKQKSPSRGRKKDRKRNSSHSPLKRSSPARKRGGSSPAKRSSPARKRSAKRGSSRKKRGSSPAKRSPAPRSGSRSRSGGRGRGGRGRDRNRSTSGNRADRRGGDRKGSRSRSGHGGKKRKKGRD